MHASDYGRVGTSRVALRTGRWLRTCLRNRGAPVEGTCRQDADVRCRPASQASRENWSPTSGANVVPRDPRTPSPSSLRPLPGSQARAGSAGATRFGKAFGFDAALVQEALPLQLFGGVVGERRGQCCRGLGRQRCSAAIEDGGNRSRQESTVQRGPFCDHGKIVKVLEPRVGLAEQHHRLVFLGDDGVHGIHAKPRSEGASRSSSKAGKTAVCASGVTTSPYPTSICNAQRALLIRAFIRTRRPAINVFPTDRHRPDRGGRRRCRRRVRSQRSRAPTPDAGNPCSVAPICAPLTSLLRYWLPISTPAVIKGVYGMLYRLFPTFNAHAPANADE